MKVITAVDHYEKQPGDIFVFLAGGITNCWDWQKEIIHQLEQYEDTDHLVVFTPRRENFPIHDPNASQEQIEWEFKYLEQMDIFSMYFCNSDSDQPICMYELGRNIVKIQNRFPGDWAYRIIISVEEGYRRAKDVEIQTRLATDNKINSMNRLTISPDKVMASSIHAAEIYRMYDRLVHE